MRHLFTSQATGLSPSALKWATGKRHWTRVQQGIYVRGAELPTPMERACAKVLAADDIAFGELAGRLHKLDGVAIRPPFVRRRQTTREVTIKGVRCANGLQTVLDLAAMLDDIRWEQAMESALFKRLCTITDIGAALATRRIGNARIKRVLKLRPLNAPPTESLLETLAVQLIRYAGLPDPQRQVQIYDQRDRFVARVDLAWPSLGVFLELDGKHHKGQPVYDANRQTRVTNATGWRCGRYTWTEITDVPVTTARSMTELLALAA